LKKKPLTRRAQAGSDVHILLDIANSLLDAQVQSGWHEARLRIHGYLDLTSPKGTARLELKGRSVERIALSLLQFGSFQDRMLLKQFLEASMTVTRVLANWTSRSFTAGFSACRNCSSPWTGSATPRAPAGHWAGRREVPTEVQADDAEIA